MVQHHGIVKRHPGGDTPVHRGNADVPIKLHSDHTVSIRGHKVCELRWRDSVGEITLYGDDGSERRYVGYWTDLRTRMSPVTLIPI